MGSDLRGYGLGSLKTNPTIHLQGDCNESKANIALGKSLPLLPLYFIWTSEKKVCTIYDRKTRNLAGLYPKTQAEFLVGATLLVRLSPDNLKEKENELQKIVV